MSSFDVASIADGIVGRMQEGLAVFDREGRCVYVNPAGERLARRPASELLGRTFSELHPDAERSPVQAAFERIVAGSDRERIAPYTAGARDTWVEAELFGVGDVICASFRDVTDAKRVQLQLEAASARLERLYELVDSLSESRSANHVADLVVGRLADALGASTAVVYLASPDGRLMLAGSRGLPEEVLARLERIDVSTPLPLGRALRDGVVVWSPDRTSLVDDFPLAGEGPIPPEALQASIALPLGDEARLLGGIAFGFARPVPRDRPTEELVLTAARHCTLALFRLAALDEALRAKAESDRLARGLAEAAIASNSADTQEAIIAAITEKARELVGAHQAIASLTTGRDWEQVIRAVAVSEERAAAGFGERLYDTGLHAIVCETNRSVRLTQAELDAHPKRVSRTREATADPARLGWLAAPLVDRDGHNLGVVQLSGKDSGAFTARDEHVLVQIAQMGSVAIENAQLVEALRQANRAKDEFLAMLGHELRNPLAPIRTAVQLMKMRDPDAFARERGTIERQVGHMVRLVDDLLDVSRIASGKVELSLEPLDLGHVVSRAVEIVSPIIEARSHRLYLDVARGIVIEGDEQRLVQVVSNLLGNAAKFTPKGGRIEIATRIDGGDVLLDVRDDGIGIGSELLPRVFDLFTQGGRGSSSGQAGLGLGLCIVQSLVTLHGGTVTATSEGPGRGSTFTIRLAALAGAADDPPRERRTDPPMSPRAVPERVLVVDDNEDAGRMLAEALATLGHHPIVARHGAEALDLLETHTPTLGLLDLGMPEMDGFELARRIRARPELARIPLVALTGYGKDEDRKRTTEAGFDAHLVKPVDLHRLVGTLERLRVSKRSP